MTKVAHGKKNLTSGLICTICSQDERRALTSFVGKENSSYINYKRSVGVEGKTQKGVRS